MPPIVAVESVLAVVARFRQPAAGAQELAWGEGVPCRSQEPSPVGAVTAKSPLPSLSRLYTSGEGEEIGISLWPALLFGEGGFRQSHFSFQCVICCSVGS